MTRVSSLGALAKATLRSASGTEIQARTLWDAAPLVVLILRRPGCVLCRDEAQRLWALKPELDKMGVGIVCLVHEWIDREIKAFSPTYWPGPLYHDLDKVFYKALNNGEVLRGSMLSMMNPLSGAWQRIRAASKNVKDHNIVGDGLTMGGVMVLRQGEGGVSYMHLEKDLGLVPSPEEVLAAAKTVAPAGHTAAAS